MNLGRDSPLLLPFEDKLESICSNEYAELGKDLTQTDHKMPETSVLMNWRTGLLLRAAGGPNWYAGDGGGVALLIFSCGLCPTHPEVG